MAARYGEILVVSPDKDLKKRVVGCLKSSRMKVRHIIGLDQMLAGFASRAPDVLLLDASEYFKHSDPAVKYIDIITSRYPATQILLLVEPRDIRIAVSAIKAGSYHYARKPVKNEELKLLIGTAMEDRTTVASDQATSARERSRFGELIGASLPMQQVYDQIEQAAHTDIPILILGETGTGKDLVARAIHRLSPRADNPYLPVNLGALPIELVASELFGHVKGAFTGATVSREGVFERAEEGTVFLDEIDTVDEKVQVSLLRLLEEKKYNRLGGQKPMKSNARIIAASNAELGKLVKSNNFRKDLFYRLDVFQINIPPLRERPGDIPLLVEDFIMRYNIALNKKIRKVSRAALECLERNDWPGNVRELKNVIQRAVLLCKGDTLKIIHLPSRFSGKNEKRTSVGFSVGTSLDDMEKAMVTQALSVTGNNRKQAAALLGISRRAIYNKLKKYDID